MRNFRVPSFPPATAAGRFLLASFIILVAGMGGIGVWVGNRIEEGIVERAAATGTLFVNSFVAPHLQDLGRSDTLSDDKIRDLNYHFSNEMLGREVGSFRVWNTDRRIIYSTDPSIVGQIVPTNRDLADALTGKVVAHIEDSPDDEIPGVIDDEVSFLEIYAPIRLRGTSNVIGVAEFYLSTGELQREVVSAQRRSWGVVGGIGLLMYGLLAVFVQRTSNTIESQKTDLRQRVTELMNLLHENQQLADRVRVAAARTTSINENFLRRFGSELHDGPIQDLGLAALQLDNIAAYCPICTANGENKPPCGMQLASAELAVQRAAQDIRAIVTGVMLPHLEQLSVEQVALRAVDTHKRKTRTSVSLQMNHLPDDAPPEVKIAFYRVIQEALINAYKHAGAQEQQVMVTSRKNSLIVEISDHGPGIEALHLNTLDGHIGLLGMRERVESLGGRFRIESARGRGTRIIAQLPLDTGDVVETRSAGGWNA